MNLSVNSKFHYHALLSSCSNGLNHLTAILAFYDEKFIARAFVGDGGHDCLVRLKQLGGHLNTWDTREEQNSNKDLAGKEYKDWEEFVYMYSYSLNSQL